MEPAGESAVVVVVAAASTIEAIIQSRPNPNFNSHGTGTSTLGSMSEKTQFAERLKAAMVAAGYEPRPSVLEKQFNARYWGRSVTFQAARRWLMGLSIPEQDKLQVIADWLGVEPQALRFGDRATRRVREDPGAWSAAIDRQDRLAIDAFLALPAPRRKLIRELIVVLAQTQEPVAK
jgi:hypothetical protein